MERALEAAAASRKDATLPAVVHRLLDPAEDAAKPVGAERADLVDWGREAAFELRRLVTGDLKGMFDGETSSSVDLDAQLVVLDLSALYNSDALGILMTCAAAWLQGVVSHGEGKTIFVVDEAWAILANLAIAMWLQSKLKLSRAWGLQNIAVIHRLSDLTATGSQGSQQERVAKGLLSDAETRVVYAQPLARSNLRASSWGSPIQRRGCCRSSSGVLVCGGGVSSPSSYGTGLAARSRVGRYGRR